MIASRDELSVNDKNINTDLTNYLQKKNRMFAIVKIFISSMIK